MIGYCRKTIGVPKHKKLSFSGIVALAVCVFLVNADACDKFFFKKKQDKLKKYITVFKKFKTKRFKQWACFLKNIFIFLVYNKNFENFYSKRYKNNIIEFPNNLKCCFKFTEHITFIGKIVEKVSETDRSCLKNLNPSADDIFLHDIVSMSSGKSFFMHKNFPVSSGIFLYTESFYKKSINNLENQMNVGLVSIYTKIPGLFFPNFLLDKSRGFVLTNIHEDSGLRFLNHLKTFKNYLHCYSRNNILFLKNHRGKIVCELIKEISNKQIKNKNFEENPVFPVFNSCLSLEFVKFSSIKIKNKRNNHIKQNKGMLLFRRRSGEIHILQKNRKNYTLKNKIFTKKIGFIFYKYKFIKKFIYNLSFVCKNFTKKKFTLQLKNSDSILGKLSPASDDFENITALLEWSSDLKKKKNCKFTSHSLPFLFSLHLLCKFRKNFITLSSGSALIGFRYSSNFDKKYNFMNKNRRFNFYSTTSSAEICFYAKRKINNFLFSQLEKFKGLNNAESLSLLGKFFCSGTYVPSSFVECYKFYKEISSLGTSNINCNLSDMYFYGKGTEPSKEFFFLFSKCFSEIWLSDFYNFSILCESIRTNLTGIKIIKWAEKIRRFQLNIENTTEEGNSYFSICLSNVIKITKESINKFIIYTAVTSLDIFLIEFIREKKNSINFLSRNFRIIFNYHRAFVNSRIEDILVENEQFFLTTENIKKCHKFGFGEKIFYFIFKKITGNGFSINYNFRNLLFFSKFKKNLNQFSKSIVIFGCIFSNFNLFFSYIRFILTNKF